LKSENIPRKAAEKLPNLFEEHNNADSKSVKGSLPTKKEQLTAIEPHVQ